MCVCGWGWGAGCISECRWHLFVKVSHKNPKTDLSEQTPGNQQRAVINASFIVHCSVVVSPFLPAKCLLINQTDPLLSCSADRLCSCLGDGGGVVGGLLILYEWPPGIIKTQLSIGFCQSGSVCLSASLSGLMKFIEWSSRVQPQVPSCTIRLGEE